MGQVTPSTKPGADPSVSHCLAARRRVTMPILWLVGAWGFAVDAVDLVRLAEPPADGEFKHLPFLTIPHGTEPPFPAKRTWPSYGLDRLRLLRALDWFLGLPLDVLRLSLGFHGPFDPEEPLQVGLRALVARGTTVVVSAGNDGPRNGTLQELARGAWVISVGATDKSGTLLRQSSRGVPGGLGPTVVADGTDLVQPPMEPGTSFAAPRVAHVAAFLARSLVLSEVDLRAAVQGPWDLIGPPVALPQVGFADTGIAPSFQQARGPAVRPILEAGGTAAQLARDDRERRWYQELVEELRAAGAVCTVTVNPTVVRRAVELVARPLRAERHEEGAGFVDSQLAQALIHDLVPSRWLGIFCPEAVEGLGFERLRALDGRLGPLWDAVRAALLFDLFFTGVILSVARVAGAAG